MPTDIELMEQALAEGKTLGEALEAPAPAPVVPQSEPPAGQAAAAPDDLAPYLTAIPEELREIMRPSLQAMLDGVRAQSAGATDAEAQLKAMNQAFATNPRGALRFLSEHYRIPVRFAEDGGAPTPQRQDPQPDPNAEIADLKQKIAKANDMGEVADLVDRLTTLKATRLIGESVAPVAAAQLSQEEQRQVDRLKQENPDIPVDTLLPQIRRRQATLRERPYLTPEESMYIELGPALVAQVRRLRALNVRASTPAERTAAGTTGPGGAAPTLGPTFDPNALSADQIMAIMRATGGVAPDR